MVAGCLRGRTKRQRLCSFSAATQPVSSLCFLPSSRSHFSSSLPSSNMDYNDELFHTPSCPSGSSSVQYDMFGIMSHSPSVKRATYATPAGSPNDSLQPASEPLFPVAQTKSPLLLLLGPDPDSTCGATSHTVSRSVVRNLNVRKSDPSRLPTSASRSIRLENPLLSRGKRQAHVLHFLRRRAPRTNENDLVCTPTLPRPLLG